MTHILLITAAVLTIAIGVAHSWIGERRLIGPLLSAEKRQGILATSGYARNVLRFAWHVTTLAWWGLAAVLAWLSGSPLDMRARGILVIIAITFLVHGLIALVMSRGRHLSWPVFFAIAALSVAPVL